MPDSSAQNPAAAKSDALKSGKSESGAAADASSRGRIKLDQFLKLHGLVESGGQAKYLIQNGEVQVNGEVELRRGRRLRQGDVIKAMGETKTVES